MRRRRSPILLLVAWLFATGAHWDAVQSVAWARMFATNVAVVPVEVALERTFSPLELCGMCLVVRDARKVADEGSAALLTLVGKAPLILQSVRTVVGAPVAWSGELGEHERRIPSGRSAPPVPPPRSGAV